MAGPNSLGQFIRECREQLGFTSRRVEELSRARPGLASISHSNLLAIEKGAHVPTFDKILTLSLIFNVPTQHFEERLKNDMLGAPAPPEGTEAQALIESGRRALDEGHDQRALELFLQAHAAASADLRAGRPEARASVSEAALQAASCRIRLGLLRVAREDLEALLGDESTPPREALRASFLLAEVYRRVKNFRLALLHARAALELASAPEMAPLRPKVLNTVANILDDRGETAEAIAHYAEAHRLLEAAGDRRSAGLVARNLGKAHARLGDLEPATRYLLECLVAAREIGDRRGLAFAQSHLARVYYLKGDTPRSKEFARQAKQIAQRENYPDVLFSSIYYLWKAALRDGQPSLARVYADRLGLLERRLETRTIELEDWLGHVASTRKVRS